ncbi:MAG: hypothetical protein ACOY82_03980 [Pseudomonadota bacterium]
MSEFARILVAAIGAVLVQPMFFIAWMLVSGLLAGKPLDLVDELSWILVVSVMVAGVFVFSFGIPVFAVLRNLGRLSCTSLGFAGFLLPGLPMAVLVWPSGGAGHSRSGTWFGNPVPLVVDGALTVYAWLSYAQAVVVAGLHGALGALVFLWIWRRVGGDMSRAGRTG